ncbi:spermidine/putrescine ABC transporter substrate-binding protein [Agromyces fucosus]|uniref:Spermidine/putrescine ABC transporter substrate-binding protein n=1 Tax=Agromyces fucosus TaxID=41985 RepID=A0A4Q2JPC2_9MICO|nr:MULTISPECIES: spermidine/putrescine ABC transporter substrate-binding protein [Agromyces]KQZ10974.1 spermidine/putrescine ABC transporter substrate-binding protein [Agromyces sp. Root1464]RXZ48904.1 spermidine/putrescine ABC transporter substrate-binding protein [Agromyces fucosus]
MSSEEIRILAPAGAAKTIRRELSRRRFLSFAAAASSAGLLAACAPTGSPTTARASGGPLESKLSIYTWGDYDAPDVLDAFTADLGPKISLSAFNSNEEMVAKLVGARGTSGYDIVVPTGTFVAQMAEHGLLAKLNHDLIPNLKHVDPTFLGRAWDPDNEYSICKAWGTTGFVYDVTAIDRELKDWNDFIDAAQNEASGRTSLLDDPSEITGIYFWANGIPWTTTDPDDLDAAEAFLVNELAPHISAFDSYPGGSAIPQATQMLMQSYNGDARLGILESPEPERWKYVLGSPATEIWMDNWAIAAGAPNPEAAHAFIDYVLSPENALAELDYIGYDTGAKGIEQVASDAGLPMLDLVFFTPEQVATMHEGELTEAQERVVQIWNATKAAAGA